MSFKGWFGLGSTNSAFRKLLCDCGQVLAPLGYGEGPVMRGWTGLFEVLVGQQSRQAVVSTIPGGHGGEQLSQ